MKISELWLDLCIAIHSKMIQFQDWIIGKHDNYK